MIVNYSTLLYGEEAAEAGGRSAEDVMRRSILAYTEICCQSMGVMLDLDKGIPNVFDIGFDPEPDSLVMRIMHDYLRQERKLKVKFCPFCGTKFEFKEMERSTLVRTKDPPEVYTHYKYEVKTITAPDIQVTK